jgi:hypothetical protein
MGDEVFAVGPSVAVTVMPEYVPGTVVGVMFTTADATLVVSACEVAVMVAVVGSPAAMVGAVYTPPALIVPPFVVVTAQVTAELLVFVTVAVNVAVCGGQLSVESFGYSVAAEGLTVMVIGGVLLLLPQAIRSPRSSSETPSPAHAEGLQNLRPAKPAATMPASGNANGSTGV